MAWSSSDKTVRTAEETRVLSTEPGVGCAKWSVDRAKSWSVVEGGASVDRERIDRDYSTGSRFVCVSVTILAAIRRRRYVSLNPANRNEVSACNESEDKQSTTS